MPCWCPMKAVIGKSKISFRDDDDNDDDFAFLSIKVFKSCLSIRHILGLTSFSGFSSL